jgi:hypothetical protein
MEQKTLVSVILLGILLHANYPIYMLCALGAMAADEIYGGRAEVYIRGLKSDD